MIVDIIEIWIHIYIYTIIYTVNYVISCFIVQTSLLAVPWQPWHLETTLTVHHVPNWCSIPSHRLSPQIQRQTCIFSRGRMCSSVQTGSKQYQNTTSSIHDHEMHMETCPKILQLNTINWSRWCWHQKHVLVYFPSTIAHFKMGMFVVVW